MTPARNLLSDAPLSGAGGGKSAAGSRTHGGDARATGDAFSAHLVKAGGTKRTQPAGAVRVPGQDDEHAAMQARRTNGQPVQDSAPVEAMAGAEEPAKDGGKPVREGERGEGAVTPLDALLAAFGASARPAAACAATEAAAIAQPPASGVPAQDPPGEGRAMSGSQPPIPEGLIDHPDRAPLATGMPHASNANGSQAARDVQVRFDPASVGAHPEGIGGASKASRSKVDFVSLRTDFEPAELRRLRSEVASDESTGQGTAAKGDALGEAARRATGKSVRERLAAFHARETVRSDGGRVEPSGDRTSGRTDTGKMVTGTKPVSENRREVGAVAQRIDRIDPGKPAEAGAAQGLWTGVGRPAAPVASPGADDAPTSQHLAGDRDGELIDDGRSASLRSPMRNERTVSTDRADAVTWPTRGGDETNSALTRQVASAVGTQISSLIPSAANAPAGASAEPSASAAPSENLRLRAGGAALKTLQIQLQPQNLGTLEVTMRLVGGQLAIHLAASEASTALALRDDADGLRKLLTKSGFDVDDAAITISTRDGGVGRFGNTAAPQNGGQSVAQGGGHGSGGSPDFGAPGQGASSGDPHSARRDQASGERAGGAGSAPGPSMEDGADRTRRGGSVYL